MDMKPTTDSVVLTLSLGASILYALNIRSQPSFSRTIFKTASTALLALFATSSRHWQLTPALALGSLGDAFLAYPGDDAFLRGLSSFLVAHLFYVSLFAGIGNGPSFILNDGQRSGLAGGMALLAPAMSAVLLPRVASSLKLPIAVYSTVVLAVVLAVLTVDNAQVVLGAVLFAISDSVLAADEFLVPRDSAWRGLMQYFVWGFYYSGQLLIAGGLVDDWDWVNRVLLQRM
ncbi:uncharacterized protein UV8b_01750 [Ustilaginoidea virens]|uniref:YhhN-like protein n=1 Tax=Ustilaginoidea virens TaxID=1159556 RepID=A0A1B5KS22_USTVR|nr:uncharacterized protein UV8b_01750 [Ustilaginoidea virens]QUC17509.1 hypothetical protein UV8b_01750 [Ustilaginoidea virens]GAO13631.1 hypothetical protein UVI_02017400 [Ustilaginoidea virens]